MLLFDAAVTLLLLMPPARKERGMPDDDATDGLTIDAALR